MTIRYARTLPPDAGIREYERTATHIREHLSAVASPDDSPTRYAAQVRMTRNETPDGQVELVGELDRDPDADYLADHYDPYDGVPDELRTEADQ